MLSMLPVGNKTLFKTLKRNVIIMGSIAKKINTNTRKIFFCFILSENFPNHEPAPVINIQFASMIPITSSLP